MGCVRTHAGAQAATAQSFTVTGGRPAAGGASSSRRARRSTRRMQCAAPRAPPVPPAGLCALLSRAARPQEHRWDALKEVVDEQVYETWRALEQLLQRLQRLTQQRLKAQGQVRARADPARSDATPQAAV